MEDILELILTILFKPFESKYDDTFGRIKNIRNKGLRILLRILLIAIPLAILFGVYCLCSYIFRGLELSRNVQSKNPLNRIKLDKRR